MAGPSKHGRPGTIATADAGPTACRTILARLVHAGPGMRTRPFFNGPLWSAYQIGSLPRSIEALTGKAIRNAWLNEGGKLPSEDCLEFFT
jgi:hypothetical protein